MRNQKDGKMKGHNRPSGNRKSSRKESGSSTRRQNMESQRTGSRTENNNA
jgi:hypothetical protein